MAIIGLPKGSGKRSRVREKSVKSQGILIWIMSGNPEAPRGRQEETLLNRNNKMKSNLTYERGNQGLELKQ